MKTLSEWLSKMWDYVPAKAMNLASTGSFEDPNTVTIDYDVEALKDDGSPYTLTSTQVLSLVSSSPNCVVTPSPTDPTGATGTLSAAPGFSGPVGGSASFTDSANPSFSLTGTWSGIFDPTITEPATLSIVFNPAASKAQVGEKL